MSSPEASAREPGSTDATRRGYPAALVAPWQLRPALVDTSSRSCSRLYPVPRGFSFFDCGLRGWPLWLVTRLARGGLRTASLPLVV